MATTGTGSPRARTTSRRRSSTCSATTTGIRSPLDSHGATTTAMALTAIPSASRTVTPRWLSTPTSTARHTSSSTRRIRTARASTSPPIRNGRCDVYTGSLVGTATIQAESVYPAQQPADPCELRCTEAVEHPHEDRRLHAEQGPELRPEGRPTRPTASRPSRTSRATRSRLRSSSPCIGERQRLERWGPTSPRSVAMTRRVRRRLASTSRSRAVSGPGCVRRPLTTPHTGQAAIDIHSSLDACIDVSVENIGTRHPIWSNRDHRVQPGHHA